MHPMLITAVKAARRAGQIINRASLDIEQIKVSVKQQADFVTEVDRLAEDAIIDILREAYPEHSILAEESGTSGDSQAEYQWIIDPLDGTTNFIHGFPQYAVSIALAHRGVLSHAVGDEEERLGLPVGEPTVDLDFLLIGRDVAEIGGLHAPTSPCDVLLNIVRGPGGENKEEEEDRREFALKFRAEAADREETVERAKGFVIDIAPFPFHCRPARPGL